MMEFFKDAAIYYLVGCAVAFIKIFAMCCLVGKPKTNQERIDFFITCVVGAFFSWATVFFGEVG